jgi:hypothetical protein
LGTRSRQSLAAFASEFKGALYFFERWIPAANGNINENPEMGAPEKGEIDSCTTPVSSYNCFYV